MTEKWQLYTQTGVDGPEYGIRIRPGYAVVGFQKEDAEAIVRQHNEEIEKPNASDSWGNPIILSTAGGTIKSDILERAKAKLAEGYTAINESVVRELITEVERLRSDMQAILVDHEVPGWAEDFRRLNDGSAFPVFEVAKKWHAAYRKAQNSNLIRKKQTEDQDARIKELEVDKRRLEARVEFCHNQQKLIERLEAAFLKLHVAHSYPKEHNDGGLIGEREQKAREALEKIKAGGSMDNGLRV